MKWYGLPEGIDAPDFEESMVNGRFDMDANNQVNEKFIQKVKDWLIGNGYTGPLSGEIVRYGQGDGYAEYMVGQGGGKTFLIHLPIGDAWQIPEAHMRGLRVADIREQVASQKRMDALFGRVK